MFEQNLLGNLYKLWNRMSSGSYFPPPVKQVEIPKASGGTRKLGVPTVSDRVAQTVVKLLIEPKLDPIFHPDSYGYRPGRSAKQAVAVTRERCWRYDWVVEFDIKAAFDQIDHGLLMKAVRTHFKEDWILLHIERWLVALFETEGGARVPRDRGTPQGGVVSPILMNLFTHYAFDTWMQRTSPRHVVDIGRRADDGVHQARCGIRADVRLHAEVVSRPRELPPQPLAEPYVTLSRHTALAVRPSRALQSAICSFHCWLTHPIAGLLVAFAPLPLQ